MTTRFCTSCQTTRDEQGGVMREANKTRRWICKPCLEHKSESIYKNRSGEIADVSKIMEKLYGRVA